MALKRYLLDTCTLIWYLENNERTKSIAEDIEYYQGNFALSMESLKELTHLLQYKKMKLDIDFGSLIKLLKKLNIDVIEFDINALKVLFSLPAYKEHPNPIDRHIISTAIAQHRILISGDSMFEKYTDFGLVFMQI